MKFSEKVVIVAKSAGGKDYLAKYLKENVEFMSKEDILKIKH